MFTRYLSRSVSFFGVLFILGVGAVQAATTPTKSIDMGPPNYCSNRLSCETYSSGLSAHGVRCTITESCWNSSVSSGTSTPLTSMDLILPTISFTESTWSEPNKVCVRKSGQPTSCWNTTAGASRVQLAYLGTCSSTATNCTQEDTDKDGTMDSADSDDDNDGVADVSDNCQVAANADQLNTDGDTKGDVCDTDDDNDLTLDIADKFPANAAAYQDNNNNGLADRWNTNNPYGCAQDAATCNGLTLDPATDVDFDGIANGTDNCIAVSNVNQLNTDGDAWGNACDTDDDNDGVADASDAFPLDVTESVDTDNDGIGNNADFDDDGDGVADQIDAAPLDAGNHSELTLPLGSGYRGSTVHDSVWR